MTRKLKITIPEGYEIDKENSTFECIIFKEKYITSYDDIARNLFRAGNKLFYINIEGKIQGGTSTGNWLIQSNNCTSRKQAEKLLAINKLMNVAKYLNKEWKPDWNDLNQDKYCISTDEKEIGVSLNGKWHTLSVFFKSKELAKQAIEILGEETIKLALSQDY